MMAPIIIATKKIPVMALVINFFKTILYYKG